MSLGARDPNQYQAQTESKEEEEKNYTQDAPHAEKKLSALGEAATKVGHAAEEKGS
jgi:hypothetical protein